MHGAATRQAHVCPVLIYVHHGFSVGRVHGRHVLSFGVLCGIGHQLRGVGYVPAAALLLSLSHGGAWHF